MLELQEGVADALDVFLGQLAVLLTQVLAERLEPLGRVDKLHLPTPMGRLAVGDNPDVGRNTGVVEHIERQRDDGLQPVVLDNPATNVALALASIACKKRGAVVDLGDTAAERRRVLHLGEHVGQEQHLTVARPRNERVLCVSCVLDDEARVLDPLLAPHTLKVRLPALSVGRVREHEIELAGGERVVRKGGVLGPTHDVVRRLPLALEEEIRFADGVGFGVDVLTVEVGGHLLPTLSRELLERLLAHGQHPACATRPIIEKIGAGLDLVSDGKKDEPGHQFDSVTRGPVLACLLVVLLVEAADELLEYGPHGVVVQAGVLYGAVVVEHGTRAQVYGRIEELLNQRAQCVGLREPRDLVAELEAVEDVLNVG